MWNRCDTICPCECVRLEENSMHSILFERKSPMPFSVTSIHSERADGSSTCTLPPCCRRQTFLRTRFRCCGPQMSAGEKGERQRERERQRELSPEDACRCAYTISQCVCICVAILRTQHVYPVNQCAGIKIFQIKQMCE